MRKFSLLLLLTFASTTIWADCPHISLEGDQLVVEKKVDASFDLVDISKINRNIILDIRYATDNNVTGKRLYSSSKCYFRKKAN